MNAGFPHLDLGDLIAGAAGQPVGDRARKHLAACEHCRLEANRWNLVADGVRGLAAAAPQAPAAPEAGQPARRRRTGPGPWRRVVLVAGSAAAVLVVLVGIGAVTGYVHISGDRTGAALTAVSGCTQLEQADGTLEQVHGGRLVVKTAGGQAVTVTTTAATFVAVSGPLLSDITDGASVMVRGPSSHGTIAAATVTVGESFSAVNPPGYAPVRGTVADRSAAGFTLVTAGGTLVPVTTSGDTLVVVAHARLDQLPAGASVFAVGQAGPDGTLSARGVAAITQLRSGPHVGVSVRDCSPSSIVDALGAISAISAG